MPDGWKTELCLIPPVSFSLAMSNDNVINGTDANNILI